MSKESTLHDSDSNKRNLVALVREFLATDPEVRVRFQALPDFLRSGGSGTGSTQPREYNCGVNGVICVAEKKCVSSEVRTRFLNTI
jgi:hypothetical protein